MLTKCKNLVDRFNKLDTTKEKISELEDTDWKKIAIIKHEELRIWKLQKARDTEDMVRKRNAIWSHRIRRERINENIKREWQIFPKLLEYANSEIQEESWWE